MFPRLRQFADERPLTVLMLVGLALRLIAVVFARGYMGSDDHYQVIEIAADWERGNHLFLSGGEQFYRSLLYPGVNWLLMALTHRLGFYHPDTVMMVNRFAHALYSLWVIVLTYRIGLLLGGKRTAWTAGLLVAAHAVMPYVAVRDLLETACIPFLLLGLYKIIQIEKTDARHSSRAWLVAGAALGLSFVIRWQVASAILGIGLYVLYRRRWRGMILLSVGCLFPIVFQGLWDLNLHGIFLGSMWVYIAHNMQHARDYVVGPWYRYVWLILGIFIPPFSLLFVAAIARYARRMGVVLWAVLAFLIVHMLVPGKQERFLLPIFPLLALMGAVGLNLWQIEGSAVWQRWIRRGWRYFWTINAVLLVIAMLDYSQKARVASLIVLYERGDATGIVADFTERDVGLPGYYLDGADPSRPNPPIYEARRPEDLDTLHLRSKGLLAPPVAPINYVLVFSGGKIDQHLAMLNARLGPVEIVAHITPSFADWLLLQLNPKYNHSKEAWVCRLAPSATGL
jgi:hypothetical protein